MTNPLANLNSRLNIFSICTNYPSVNQPTLGLFVQRRLAAVSDLANIRVLVPKPSFPILKPWKTDLPLQEEKYCVDIQRMFYIPKIATRMNGMWMDRCIETWIKKTPRHLSENMVLDAHFGFPEGVGVWRVAQRRKLPFFITIRGLETDLFKVNSIRNQLVQALKSATGVIAVSESLKATAVENGICDSQIQVIGNGVDNTFYFPGSKTQSRTKLGVKASAKLIVSIGTIRQLKGYDILLEAVQHFRNDPDFRCVILGRVIENSFYQLLLDRIAALGMQTRIEMVGPKPTDQVVDWLRAADMFVLPTRREGCCNVVLEALSTGVPVITTPAGDNVHYVANGHNGFIVPHESPSALFDAIEQSWNYPWNPQSISDSVRPYTWEGTAKKVIDYFSERLAQHKSNRDIPSLPPPK